MIVPMKKFSLIAPECDREKVPERLKKLGIAHIEELQGKGEAFQNLEQKKIEVESAYYYLQSFIEKKSISKKSEPFDLEKCDELYYKSRQVVLMKQKFESLVEQANGLQRQIEAVLSWGDFSLEDVKNTLAPANLELRFFEGPLKELRGISPACDYVFLNESKGKVRIALIVWPEKKSAELPSSFMEFVPPQIRISEMRTILASIHHQKDELVAELRKQSSIVLLLKKYLEILNADIVLERARSGMPQEQSFAYLSGYIPARESEKLKEVAAKYAWAVVIDDPSDEEQPPTLVENPAAIRIIQPVFDFLGTVPNYREYDISLWFLIFFSIFFAMIFGDASYGAIIAFGSLISIFVAKRKGRSIADAQKLFLLLGIMTIVWGALTATWFSINFNSLPRLLQNISLSAINGQSPQSENNIKAICFLIGLVQLCIAHVKNIKRDYPNLKFLSQAGSLFLLFGMFNLALNLVIDAQRFPLGNWAIICIAIGFVLVFMFGNWNGKLISSLLESLKNIIPTFLGTVSVFADIVSYIRLWAVSLAGLAFAQTINGMAGGILSGPAGFVIGFIIKFIMASVILVAAHSLNFVLTILSVIVHGIRLNMLEFSGHLGMEWSGYKYNPLKENGIASASLQSAQEESDV